MKKGLSLLLALLMLFSVTACNTEGDNKSDVGNGEANNTTQGDNNQGNNNPEDEDNTQGGDASQEEDEEHTQPVITRKTYGSFWLPQTDYTTMPIGAYNGLPPNGNQNTLLNDYTFDYEQVLSDYNTLGVNFLFGGLYNFADTNLDYEKTTLELCEKYAIAYLSKFSNAHFQTSTSLNENKAKLNELLQYSSLLGLIMVDEPGYKSFSHMATAKDAFMTAIGDKADDYLYHCNLLPNWAISASLYNYQAGSYAETDWNVYKDYTYEQYLSDYMRIYQPQVLSYDFYPMVGDEKALKDGYFENLSVIREAALEANVPFWTFVQTCSWSEGQRLPSQGELLWNVNTCLAYGAKGIEYFCGIEPWNSSPEEHFSGSLFYKDGTHVPVVYDSAYIANKQIQAIDEVLMCSKNKGVIFVGQTPALCDGSGKYMTKSERDVLKRYKQLVSASAWHTLIGCFDYNGKTALYVVNNSTTQTDSVNLQFTQSVKGYCVRQGVKDDGFNASSLSLRLDVGEGVLVVIE